MYRKYLDETEADVIFSNMLIIGRIESCRWNGSEFLDSGHPLNKTVVPLRVVGFGQINKRL